MTQVHIAAESSARLPNPELWSHPLLTQIPYTVRSGGHEAQEDPQWRLASYSGLLAGDSALHAEPPSVDRIAEIYGDLHQKTNQILSLHTANSASRLLGNAQRASERFLGRCDIQVLDSKSLSAGLGLMVQAAVEAAERGDSLESIVRLVRGMIPRVYLVFFLDDLMHLERQGLITRSQAILGNMLGVIAFLTMEDGRLIPMEKVRSRVRALEKVVDFVAEFSHLEHIAVLQPTQASTDDGRWIREQLQEMHPNTPLTYVDYGPTTASLVGRNGLGVVVLETEDELL